MRAVNGFPSKDRSAPVDRILNDTQDVFVVVGGIGFMPWLEVEYPSVASGSGTAGTEHLAAAEPARKD